MPGCCCVEHSIRQPNDPDHGYHDHDNDGYNSHSNDQNYNDDDSIRDVRDDVVGHDHDHVNVIDDVDDHIINHHNHCR